MRVTKIFKQGFSLQTTLPPTITKALKWNAKDYLAWEIFEKDVVISKIDFPPHIIKRLSERRQRVYEQFQGPDKGRKETEILDP